MTNNSHRSAATDSAGSVARRAVSAVDRDVRSRVLATLTKKFGDLDLAEDALQDAIAQALITWSRTGVPDSPEAWLTTTAKRKALDVVRRESVLAGKLARLHTESERASTPAEFRDPAEAPPPGLPDERLGMFFACTHPVLRAEDRVALTLRFVAGLTTAEVAHALLIPVPTTQQRIVRAKKRIGALGVPFAPPREGDLPRRLGGVLRVIYLLFSEGFARSTGDAHIRDDLTGEAVALARTLRALLPNAETTGLLALLLLTQSRRPARLDSDGRPVPLDDQDRRLWDRALVAEGVALAEHAAAQADAGLYTIQAAIAAVHAEAATADETDWTQIAVLYRLLEVHDPGPVVRVGRAVAVGRAYGPARGIAMLDRLQSDTQLDRFRPLSHRPCPHAERTGRRPQCGRRVPPRTRPARQRGRGRLSGRRTGRTPVGHADVVRRCSWRNEELHLARRFGVAPDRGPSSPKVPEAGRMGMPRSNVHHMPSYWVMPAVALISCIIIGIGFIIGIPGGDDND